MSNIYIQEPPTCGKVLLITTVGDIDVELWSKEAPKACRNFIQLAMEGYYNGTIFHRIVKGFIAQGGDPSGTGTGGESIYGQPFKDEFHSRLRFCRRGLVAMANSGKDDNGSQFFFTFAACPELQNKHTIFGKVTGETIYNMIKLEDAITDENETPLYPQKIIKIEILNNPFPDIVPRCLPERRASKKKTEKSRTGVKNFKLLSFGEEAAEDEEENKEISQSLAGKSKSTHDALNDPKLSSKPVIVDYQKFNKAEDIQHQLEINTLKAEDVKNKLKRKSETKEKKLKNVESQNNQGDEEDSNEEYDFGKKDTEAKRKRLQEIAKEIKDLKRDYQKNKKPEKKSEVIKNEGISKKEKEVAEDNELVKDYKNNLEKYRNFKSVIPKKGSSRENMTLQLLDKFKKRLQVIKEKTLDERPENSLEEGEEQDYDDSESWLAHKLNFEGDMPVLAKDANTKTDDWFDITDPRNPINKRRREQGKNNASKQH